MEFHFAKRTDLLRASEIREILKITEREEVISFAGGLPAPELFPIEEMKEVSVKVLETEGKKALQYSTTEGYEPLRQQIAARMKQNFRTNFEANEVLITSGSQQALDLLGKLFIDEDDVILCESPTYLAAISVFRSYRPRFIEVPTDEGGMIIEELEKILQTTRKIKLIYVIPDFQNPTGKTWPIERRQEFMKLVQKYKVPVIEDNPYGELRFENEMLPSLQSMDDKGLVICLGTFSKTFCPGMRIGWLAADGRVIAKCVLLKQGADLCTSLKTQMEISYYIAHYDFEANIQLPTGVTCTQPQGGLFLWLELPKQLKAVELLKECLLQDVAFVPGDSFFPNGGVTNTLRLNYSNMPEDKIREGIKRLSYAIRKSMG
ncbi:MAG: putative transcriptional regulator, GntR family [Firmicutes bacterium]|nr:putative transcriptional regulator, GntR family [Bacillota bacterium]